MHHALKVAVIAVVLSLVPLVAEAGRLEGAGIGAGAGAVVAGPPGAIVGGVIGAAVGGPNIITGRHHHWRNHRGYRHGARR